MARAPSLPSAIEYGTRYGPQAGNAIQRSQYLADALQSLDASARQGIRTPMALGTNLLSSAILEYGKAKSDKEAIGEVTAQRKGISDRISELLGGAPQSGGSPMADFIDPRSGQPMEGQQPAPQKPQGPVPYTDPRWARLGTEAQLGGFGAEVAPAMEWAKNNKPHMVFNRGQGFNDSTGDKMGGFMPELDKGQALGADGSVQNLPNAVQAAAQMAGGVESAKAAAQAPYQPVQTFNAQGQPMTINAMALAQAGQPFVGQSPAQTAADTATASAGAAANVGLPQSQASSQQALDLIDSLKADPEMKYRTGLVGILPSMPGTGGVGFDAKAKQLTGKVFLEAYAGLKGGGQITEVEGKKAQEAVARLDRAQSQEDYTAALDDLRGVISSGMQRAQQQPQRLQPNAAPGGGGQQMPPRDAVAAELRKRGLIR